MPVLHNNNTLQNLKKKGMYHEKNCVILAIALSASCLLSACSSQAPASAGTDAAELVMDIATTQYFTDEAVNDKDIEKILLVGKEDTSVDKNADGYTGATERNPLDEVVAYVTK